MVRWLRGLVGRHEEKPNGRRSHRRPGVLLEFEGIERPPEDLLVRLRNIDPRVELFGVGDGNWWLMRRIETRDRRRIAGNMLASTLVTPKNRWIRLNAKLAYRGFGMIADFYGAPDGRIVNHFQRVDWKDRHGVLDAEFETSLLYSDDTIGRRDRLAVLRSKLDQDSRSIHRYAFRHPVSSSGSHLRRRTTA